METVAVMKMVRTGFGDMKDKGLRVAGAAIVATVALEMLMQVGAPNVLGIPPTMTANVRGLKWPCTNTATTTCQPPKATSAWSYR